MTAHEIEQLEALNQRIEEDRQRCLQFMQKQSGYIRLLGWLAFLGWFVALSLLTLLAVYQRHGR